MKSFKYFVAGIAALTLTVEASAQRQGSPSLSIGGSYYVLNYANGVVSVCYFHNGNLVTPRGPTCSIAGTFPNVTTQTRMQTDANSPVAWVIDRNSGRVMRCELTLGRATFPDITGASCTLLARPVP